ncbi:MAG: GNAT family N-acetyltransferase [Candidatus Cloacimonetes bacterium]|nr:GNAT family N-acetyltransferase [Candidatus Cloacimonadota bacterium]
MQTIRKIVFEEYDDLIKLWEKAGLSHRPRGRDSRENIERQFRESNTIFLGGFEGSNLVSAAIVSHNGRKGWINRLAVHPDHRRRHLASELISASEKWLLEHNIEIFAVLIEDDNEDSMKLFEKNNYRKHTEIIYFTKKLREEV